MTNNIHSASSYIYEADNIPNRESRLYGLSKRLMAVLGPAIHPTLRTAKKPH